MDLLQHCVGSAARVVRRYGWSAFGWCHMLHVPSGWLHGHRNATPIAARSGTSFQPSVLWVSRTIMWLTVTFRGDKPDLRAILYAYINFSSLAEIGYLPCRLHMYCYLVRLAST